MTDVRVPLSILLVEDEPRLRQTLERSLTSRGHLVELASTAAEASDRALSGRHDVMLLDVNLPDATGWDVLRALRDADCTLPSIVLSAAPPNPTRVREFRPAGVLYKPFPMDALLRLIQTACRNGAANEHGFRPDPNEEQELDLPMLATSGDQHS